LEMTVHISDYICLHALMIKYKCALTSLTINFTNYCNYLMHFVKIFFTNYCTYLMHFLDMLQSVGEGETVGLIEIEKGEKTINGDIIRGEERWAMLQIQENAREKKRIGEGETIDLIEIEKGEKRWAIKEMPFIFIVFRVSNL
ncbi:hypothetical protein ACJX0J_030905, partial [Zea mays]